MANASSTKLAVRKENKLKASYENTFNPKPNRVPDPLVDASHLQISSRAPSPPCNASSCPSTNPDVGLRLQVCRMGP